MCTSMNDTIYLSCKYVCKKVYIEIIINSFLYALLMTLCKLIKNLLHPPLTPAPVPEVVFESRTVSRRNTMMIRAWWHILLRTNQRPVLRSRDLFWPIRGNDDPASFQANKPFTKKWKFKTNGHQEIFDFVVFVLFWTLVV